MSPTDHRAEAIDALALIQASDNPIAEISSASESTAHVLLAIEERLGQLVEQQRIANLNLAASSGALTAAERRHVQDYIGRWCIGQLATDNARRYDQETESA